MKTSNTNTESDCGNYVADLTEGKEFDTPTSVFLAAENEKLKERIKELETKIEFLEIYIRIK